MWHWVFRLSSDTEQEVETEEQNNHKVSYGVQNIRYIFQVMTDAVALRQVV